MVSEVTPSTRCRHKPRPGTIVVIEYPRSEAGVPGRDGTVREAPVNSCVRCGRLLSMGAPTDSVPAEIRAAALIQDIGQIAPPLAIDDPIMAARTAAAGVIKLLPEVYGWGAAEAFYGTPGWDAGWLAAAYFGHDPHATKGDS